MEDKIKIEPNKFGEYLITAYSNENTQKQYLLAEQRFLGIIKSEELNQMAINKFIVWVRQKKDNPFYMGFLKAYMDCYDPDGQLPIRIIKDKSKKPQEKRKPYHLSKEQIDILIANCTPQLRLMVRLYYETGLRLSELLNTHRKNIDLRTRHLKGIGKGNKPFKVHFSKKSAYWISKWLDRRKDEYPFKIKKKGTGDYYKNQPSTFRYFFKKQANNLLGVEIHPHLIRHALGYHLRANKRWDLEQIRTKLRHSRLDTTQIYASATSEEIEKKEDKELFDGA